MQRAFGTDEKSLQVGFAVEARFRAARLSTDAGEPAVPGGLAVKIYPARYALQRPISALAGLRVDPADVTRIDVRTPAATVAPLAHHRPSTGLQGKFSLEYACAAALLDSHQGFASFDDAAVRRAAAGQLVELVHVELGPGGDRVLAGAFETDAHTAARGVQTACTVSTPTRRCGPGRTRPVSCAPT